jgi:hypothetical protein
MFTEPLPSNGRLTPLFRLSGVMKQSESPIILDSRSVCVYTQIRMIWYAHTQMRMITIKSNSSFLLSYIYIEQSRNYSILQKGVYFVMES